MGKLARLSDVQTIIQTQRDSLASFLNGLKATVNNLVATFTTDTASMSGPAHDTAQRVLDRATTLVGNINFEIAQLGDTTQSGDRWWSERVSSARTIVADTQTLSGDMIGFLETGTIPSEEAARRQTYIFAGAAVGLAAFGYWLWHRAEMAAEAEQTAMIESGELEDCGCTG